MSASTTPKCPYCRSPWTTADSARCPSCDVVTHRDCWAENGGCSVAACPSSPDGAAAVASAAHQAQQAQQWQQAQPAAAPAAPSWATAAPQPAPQPAPVAAPPGIPQGWYPDPVDATRYRWWDGVQWTDHFSPR